MIEWNKSIDEFERDFKKLRDDSRMLKDKLKERASLIESATEKSAYTVCTNCSVNLV